MGIVEILALIVAFAGIVFGLANVWFGICSKSNGFEDRAKSEFLIAGITFVIIIVIIVCLNVFSPNLKSGLGNWRDQSMIGNAHDADCQCIECKPHDADCQCNDCVKKYCNSFNHGDTCQCEKCLYCKEYGE